MQIIAIDTETADTETQNNVPFLATSTDTALISKVYHLNGKEETEDYLALKAICESSGYDKVFHNAVYDIYCLSLIGINVVAPFEDTMLMTGLINENYDSKKLKVLAKTYLNEECLEDAALKRIKNKLIKSLEKIGFEDTFTYKMIPPDILLSYAIKDTEYTIKLYYYFLKPVNDNYKVLYDFEKSLILDIVEMIKVGLRIDRPFVKNITEEYAAEVDSIYTNILDILDKNDIYFVDKILRKTSTGIINYANNHGIDILDVTKNENTGVITATYEVPFNSNSVDDIRYVLTNLNVDITKVTEKTGELCTDAEILKSVKNDDSDGYRFVEALIRYRFLNKQLTSYFKPLYKRYTYENDDIAHFTFYQSGAKSGRFTAKLIQTIPRKDEIKDERFIKMTRKAFIPKKNKAMVFIDYDQIEMRIFASNSNCALLINDINNGLDAHYGTAINLFGQDAVNNDKKELRRRAKTINFGIIYGMGQAKLAHDLKLPLIQAIEILSNYYAKYPVKPYIAQLTSMLCRQGFVNLSYNSPLMSFNRDYRVPPELAYKAVNILTQGSAAYVMKYGMKRVLNFITKEKLNIKLACTLHDELIFDICESDYSLDLVKALIEQMEDRETFAVPITATAKFSKTSWADAEEIIL